MSKVYWFQIVQTVTLRISLSFQDLPSGSLVTMVKVTVIGRLVFSHTLTCLMLLRSHVPSKVEVGVLNSKFCWTRGLAISVMLPVPIGELVLEMLAEAMDIAFQNPSAGVRDSHRSQTVGAV